MNFEIFAQAMPPDPAVGATFVFVGVVLAAAAGTYQRFLSVNNKAEAERVRLAVEECDRRCREKDDKLWLLQEQFRESERQRATWQTRCESLGWPERQKPSPPRTGNA